MNEKKFLKKLHNNKNLRFNKNNEILKKFYNTSDGLVHFPLEFEKFSDLFITKRNTLTPVLTEGAKESFNRIIEMPIKMINLQIDLYIKDKENYSIDEIYALLQSNFQLMAFSIKLKSKVIRRRSLSIFFLGCIFLTISYFIYERVSIRIINDIANIAGTLLVWEGCYGLIVERSSQETNQLKYSMLHLNTKVE